MTRAIEDELGLPRLEDALKEIAEAGATLTTEDGEELSEDAILANAEVERMSNALANFDTNTLKDQDADGTVALETEMNDVIATALQAHKDLMDLGFNMEPKNAGQVFTPATRMLEIAMSASKNKAEQRAKAIKLRMEQEAHAKAMREGGEEDEGFIEGEIPTAPEKAFLAKRSDVLRSIKDGKL